VSESALEPRASVRQRPWALLAAIAIMLAHVISIQPWMVDDAFIFFRYAENWAGGHGVVYNAGEHVEGYTSFAWLALLAAGHRLGVNTVLLAQILGVVAAIATLVVVARAYRRGLMSAAAATYATLFLGTCGTFTAWPASGMETALFALGLTLFVVLHAAAVQQGATSRRHGLARGALAAVLVMTRPEGLAVIVLACLDLVRRRRMRAALWVASAFAVVFVPYFAWRWAYYGWPLPNTFYAKIGMTPATLLRGAGYVLRFLRAIAPLAALGIAAVAVPRARRAIAPLGFAAAVLGIQLVYVVAVGGDAMPAFRFLAPYVSLVALIAGSAVASLFTAPRLRIAAAALILVWGVGTMRFDPDVHGRIRQDLVAEVGETVGRWLHQIAPSDAVLATNTAGSIPYYSGLRTIDMLGLTDEHIAHRQMPSMGRGVAGHEKHDGAYVISRRPDYIHFGTSLGSPRPAFPSDFEVASQPDFARLYELESYELQSDRGRFTVHFFHRKSP
jgi:arabinofuranosyltransferase